MDKRRIRKYKQLQERIYRAESEYVQTMLDSVSESGDSRDTLSILEESQCALEKEIEEIKNLLNESSDERYKSGDR